MLKQGYELEVQGGDGKSAGIFVVIGLRAHGGQGYVYTLRGPDKRPAVLKVPGPKGVFSNEIEVRILKNLPPHKNVIPMHGTAVLQGVECAILGWGHPNPFQRLNAAGNAKLTRRFRGLAPKTPLPASTAIELTQELLAALEHIHRYSYVHGDLKPANVLVQLNTHRTRLSNQRFFEAVQRRSYTTVVADFGSSRSLSFLEEQDAEGKRIAPSEFTPVFAPPEIFDKEQKHSGQAVDIYQVGLMLYQMLTGYLPYDHQDPAIARGGLSRELVRAKRDELAGKSRAWDPQRIKVSRHQDVVFAEAFASQQMRDRFFEDAERLIELATLPDPSQRPTASQLRAEMFRMFELEPPPRQASSRKVQVSVWNPRWHLARDNRLAAAGRAPDPEQDRMLDEEEVLTQHVSTADEDVTMPVDLPADGPPPVSRSNLPTQRLPEEVEPAAASAVRAPAARRSGLPTQKLDDEALDVDDLASIRFTQMYRKLTDQEPTPEPVRAAHQGRPSGRPPRPSGRNQPPQRGSSGRQPPPSRGGTGRPPPPPRASRRAPPPPSGRRGPPPPRDRPSGRSPAEEPVPTVPDAGFDPDDPLKGLRVALVDDDRVALAVLGRALKKRGCNVATFQDPEAALESISRDSPNAAIVDMQMPGISGLDLLRRLSRRLNGLPFPLMILSSVEEEGVLKEAFRLGARDYMVKPVTEAELAVKLEKAVKIHHEECPQSVPRELNGFELLEELRRGEVAVVYRAADTWDRYPDVLKAIKVLRPDLVGEPEPLLKLRRELDVLADCDHPGLARVVESGLVGKFLYYVADELPARTLAHEVREGGAFSPDKVIAFLREGADILAHLHQQAFLVGDLSPESFARRDDGRFMLCELGNARRLSGVLRQDEPDLPRSRYGPPELFMEPPQLDLRADVYALGVCALEAHTGKPAVRSRATGAIDVEAVAQGLPRAILPVVTRMVAASPDDRYPDADAVLQDLVRRLRPPRR